jgi:hypothetical protein
MNNKGNILINSVMTLVISSVVIVNISRTTVQSTFIQDRIMAEELAENTHSSTDEVNYLLYDQISESVYEEFEDKYEFYSRNLNSWSNKFKKAIDSIRESIDPTNRLECDDDTVRTKYKGGKRIDYTMTCTASNGDKIHLVFEVNEIKKKDKKTKLSTNSMIHYYIIEESDE